MHRVALTASYQQVIITILSIVHYHFIAKFRELDGNQSI